LSVGCSNLHKTEQDAGEIGKHVNWIIAVENADQSIKLKNCSKEIDLDTPFFIGSVSKQMTAILAIKHLDLNSDVTTLITEDEFQAILMDLQKTESTPFWSQLKLSKLKGTTIRDLLMHSVKIDYATGAQINQHKYHNLNYALVGKCLEKQTKRPYNNLAHDLFAEAGMNNTFLHDDFSEKKLWGKLRKALAIAKCSPQKLVNPLTRTMTPAGGVVSTARDLLKWNKFLKENKLFEALTKTIVTFEKDAFYGLGIITDKDKMAFFHTGAIAAVYLQGILFTCVLIHDHKENYSFVGFDVSNIVNANAVSAKIDERTELLMQKCIK
jgi:CubicO group peptidase (beta-lactamase class C family)